MTGGQQNPGLNRLISTEKFVEGSSKWREVKGGELPSARLGLKGISLNNNILMFGGLFQLKFLFKYLYKGGNDGRDLDEILQFDIETEQWRNVSSLSVASQYHAVSGVYSKDVENYCEPGADPYTEEGNISISY